MTSHRSGSSTSSPSCIGLLGHPIWGKLHDGCLYQGRRSLRCDALCQNLSVTVHHLPKITARRTSASSAMCLFSISAYLALDMGVWAVRTSRDRPILSRQRRGSPATASPPPRQPQTSKTTPSRRIPPRQYQPRSHRVAGQQVAVAQGEAPQGVKGRAQQRWGPVSYGRSTGTSWRRRRRPRW